MTPTPIPPTHAGGGSGSATPALERGVADRIAAAKLWLISEQPNTSGRPTTLPTHSTPGTASTPQANTPQASGSLTNPPAAPRDLGYLATALYSLIPVASTDVKRLSADEHWRLYLNPSWVSATDIPDVGRELAHVLWHLLMAHADRARTLLVGRATAHHWSLATDLTIVHTLGPDDAAPIDLADTSHEPIRAVLDKLGPGRSSEEYYAVLSGLPAPSPDDTDDDPANPSGPDQELPDCGSACDGIPRPHDVPADSSTPSVDRAEADQIRTQVAIDYQGHVTGRGDTPGEALRWAMSLTDPQIPWEPLLNRAVRRAIGYTSGRTEYTWSRPSRRQSALPQVRLPGTRRPIPRVAIIIDTSASMDDHLLGTAIGEVTGALTGLGVSGEQLTVISCDAALGAISHVRNATDITLTGGGGTDLRVAFTHIDTMRPRPDVIVTLTDGYTP